VSKTANHFHLHFSHFWQRGPSGYAFSCQIADRPWQKKRVFFGAEANFWRRFLDIALICEFRGDIKMAELVAARAVETKKNCQGADFPNYARYAEVLSRIRSKMLSLGGR
jgi:hypothetical protein